jgi:hypothetical protein
MKVAPKRASRDWHDLAAFPGCLIMAILLLVVGHLAVASLVTACAALMGVYGVWKHCR